MEDALDTFRQIGARSNEAWALNQYAEVFAASGDLTRALAVHNDALRLTRELDMPDKQALALEGIGEIHLRTGSSKEGVDHLKQALTIFQQLAQQPDVARVNARLAALEAL
jgi:tetratricopeptide (TPR) repeat protein